MAIIMCCNRSQVQLSKLMHLGNNLVQSDYPAFPHGEEGERGVTAAKSSGTILYYPYLAKSSPKDNCPISNPASSLPFTLCRYGRTVPRRAHEGAPASKGLPASLQGLRVLPEEEDSVCVG